MTEIAWTWRHQKRYLRVPIQLLSEQAAESLALKPQNQAAPIATERSVGEVLRLVGCEPAGSILTALGQRPLRTGQLTERVTDYSARSVYRCLAKLENFGLVEHRSEPEKPSRALLALTEPAGRNLLRLLRRFTSESTAGASSEEQGLSWEALCELSELWEWGFAAELGHGSRSLVHLLDGTEGLTYHQVRRRACQFVDAGLLSTALLNGSGRHYELTEQARRRMVVVASLGRWRHRYLLADGTPGLETQEMATVLRTTLPLVKLPGHGGRSIDFLVVGIEGKDGVRDEAKLRCVVDREGTLGVAQETDGDPDGSATATLNTWFAALLDGSRGRVRVRGDLELVDACLTRLYDELWAAEQ